MAFPNVSDILATTIENRSRKTQDQVTKNNGLLAKLKSRGNVRTFSGGHKIYEELLFAENANFGWYSGYDPLSVNASDVVSAAEFSIKQCAAPVVMSGLEMLQNAGKEKMIDLMQTRLAAAEATMSNNMSQGLYGDGTASSGKTIVGLDAMVPLANTTGTYGGINRATWTFWRNQILNTTGVTASTIQASWNTLWANLQRGSDRPDLIIVDSTTWGLYLASLQVLQRFTSPDVGNLGFPTLKFMDADVLLDGGIGGYCPAGTAFFLNTKYVHYRPHAARNMVPLSPNRRYSTNQDAEVQILAWAGNLTCSGAQFQGRWDNN
jgi:hypothetical protein